MAPIFNNSHINWGLLEIIKNMVWLEVFNVNVDKKYSDNVLLIKRTKNQDELAMWYSLADLFLICSNKENFPTTCLEALSCGTPIVGIDAGGTKETAPKPYGVFVEKRELLNEKISEQISKEYSAGEIRKTAVELYSKQVMCEAYKKLYDEICNS